MKRNYYLMLSFMALFAISGFAKTVKVEDAYRVAKSHLQRSTTLKSAKDDELKLVYTAQKNGTLKSTKQNGDAASYYVFNINESDGFIIVSGDDVAIPVLGYSEKGFYDQDNLPPGFVYWLGCLQEEIDDAVEKGLVQDKETQEQWKAYLKGQITSRGTGKILVETQWNQYGPYNDLCPTISGTRTVTGCVATAMAQLMYYHKCPATTGVGMSDAYETRDTKIPIPSVNFGSTTYCWSDMAKTYPISGYADPNSAVATLMYHCAVSVEMNFDLASNGGSGAPTNNVGRALPKYFRYDKSVQAKARDYYTDEEWHAMLKKEIDAQRPVLYSGRNASSGHAFICDGYDNDNKFHFNWGWGGYRDSYFPTSALNPGSGGAGSGVGTYNQGQSIVINIMPDGGGAETYEMKIKEEKLFFTDNSTSKTVSRGEDIQVNAPFYNAGITDFTGIGGYAIVDTNDDIIEVLGSRTLNLPSTYAYSTLSISGTIPTNIAPGTYYIRTITKLASDANWTLAKGKIGSNDRLTITIDNTPVLTHAMKIINNSFVISKNTVMQNESLVVEAQLKNGGSVDFTGDYGAALFGGDGNIVEVVGVFMTGASLQAGYNYTSPFSRNFSISDDVPAGLYTLRVVAKPNGEDWSAVYGATVGDVDVQTITVTALPTSIENEGSEDISVGVGIDYVIITSERSPIKDVQLFDLSSKKQREVKGADSYEVNLFVAELPSGVYLLRIETAKGLVIKKITK